MEKEIKLKEIKPEKLKRRFDFLRWATRYFLPLFYRYKLHGNLTMYSGRLIIVGNHYSYLDVAFPLLVTKEPPHFVAKQELWESGGAMRRFVINSGTIPVKRDGGDVQAVKDCLRILKSEGVITIFPEGTRNRSYKEFLPFKSGAALLSIKTRTPIVPIVKVTKLKLFRTTHIIIGDPIEFRQFYNTKPTKEDLERCDETLRQAMQNMRLAFLEKHNIKIKSDKV